MKHIFIPTDFSDSSDNALRYALELALITKAKCTLLHAYEMPSDFASQVENRIVAIREKAKKKLNNLLNELQADERYGQLEMDCLLKEGSAEEEVAELAEGKGADLIVIGITKHSRIENIAGENTGAELVGRSQVPVLAIPEKAVFSRPREIVYAAEYREEDLENLEELSQWAKLFDAQLKVVHIADKKGEDEKLRFKDFERDLDERLSYPYVNNELHVSDEVEEGILETVAGREGVILSMAHYHKSFLKKIFGSSHTKTIALKTMVPLLVYYEYED